MRRLIAIILVVALVVGLMTGCLSQDNNGQDGKTMSNSTTENQNDKGPEPVTIRYMTWNTTEVTLQNAYLRFKQEFENINPHITVEYVDIPYGNMVQQAFTYAASDNLPDIVEAATPFLPSFITSDILMLLNGVVSQELLDDIQEVSLSEVMYEGKIMAIPRIIIPQVLYYNKTLFEKAGLDPERPPKTYDEMLEMARKLSKLTTDTGEKIYGIGEGLAKASNNGLFSLRNFVGFGAEFKTVNNVIEFDRDSAIETLNYYRTIVNEGLCPQSALPKDLRNLFATGRLGMYFDVSNQSATLNAINPKGDAFEEEYAKAVVPINKNGKSNTTSNTASICISASSRHADEAAKFIEWLMSKDAYAIYFDENNTVISTRKSLANDPLFTEGKDLDVLSKQYPAGMVSLPEATTYMEQFYLELATAFQAATQTNESLENIVDNLIKNIQELSKE